MATAATITAGADGAGSGAAAATALLSLLACFLLTSCCPSAQGFSDAGALPTSRGWEKSFNFYGGGMDYYSKVASAPDVGDNLFFDIHAMGEPDRTPAHIDGDYYSGDLWQLRAEQIITEHAALGTDQPLFLYYAMQTPHDPMQVPESYTALAPCDSMTDTNRTIYCGMVHFIDESCRRTHFLFEELLGGGSNDENDDGNLLFVFQSDNGGQPNYGGYNMPLRGTKGTLFEGGVRSASLVWKADLPEQAQGSSYGGLMHVTDWLPTLMEVASGGSWAPEPGRVLDGYSQWSALLSSSSSSSQPSNDHSTEAANATASIAPCSPRESLIVNFYSGRGAAVRWDTPDGEHRYKLILNHLLARAVWVPVPTVATVPTVAGEAQRRRTQQDPDDGANCTSEPDPIRCSWLFDLMMDEDEATNLYDELPEVVAQMIAQLDAYADDEVTCEAALTCGPPDPAATAAFEEAGYFVPWINVANK